MSVLIGSFIGRRWSILLAIPAGVLAQSMYSFEGFSDGEVASLFGVAAAIGLAFGVALRKILVRRTSNATGSIE